MIRQYALLSLFISFFVFVSFLYFGITNPPPLGDSHDYHIPIAKDYLNGTLFNIPKSVNSYINFPGASESILAVFILFHIPVNWFCLLGWVVLFFLLRKLGMHFKLGSELSVIYATAFTTTISVLRQIATQSIDMWIAVWFVLLVLLLEKPQKKIIYFFSLGIVFGMLVGSKDSGALFMIILLAVYGLNLIKVLSLSNIFVFLPPFLILGVSWYVRNFLAWDNPMYPIPFLMFPGNPGADIPNYLLWKEILRGHGLSILQWAISEYLIWGLSFIPFLVLFVLNLKKKFIDAPTTRVFWLSFLLFLSAFFFSFKPHFVVSNMRYLFPVIIILMLSLFIMAKKFKLKKEIALLAVLNAIAAISYIIYHPKLVIIYFVLSAFLYLKGKNYINHFISEAS